VIKTSYFWCLVNVSVVQLHNSVSDSDCHCVTSSIPACWLISGISSLEYLIFHWCGLCRQGVVAGRSFNTIVSRLGDSLLFATSQLVCCHSSTQFTFIKPQRFYAAALC